MKKVIFKDTVNVDVTKWENIYAFVYSGEVFILKGIRNTFAWLSFKNCLIGWNGGHGSFENAMKSVSDRDVFEFSDLQEFKNWLVLNI